MSIQLKLINNDIDTLERVYRLHFKKVFNVVRKYVNDDSCIDDLTQDVFLKLWLNRNLISIDLPIEQQLFTITKNVVFNHFRKKVNEKKVFNEYQIMDSTFVNEEEDDKIKRLNQVKSLMKKLPKKQRKIFKMYRFEGLTYQEIATSLNISKNTVSNHLSTAMSFIKKNMSSFFF